MNYTKILWIGLLLVNSYPLLYANNGLPSILENTEVTWAAEVQTLYAPALNDYTVGAKKMKAIYGMEEMNRSAVLKIQRAPIPNSTKVQISNLASKLMKMPKQSTVYKDADLTIKLALEEYEKKIAPFRDTIYTIDATTKEKIAQPFYDDGIQADEIQVFKLKQILLYNAKTNQLNIVPVAIAPLMNQYNHAGEWIAQEPLFWFPVQELTGTVDLTAPNISWAKRMTRTMDATSLKVLKGKQTLGEVVAQMVQKAQKKPATTKLYYNSHNLRQLSATEIANIYTSVDTIITFNEAFEEEMDIVENRYEPSKTTKIRLVQDWYWDETAQKLSIQLFLYGPMSKTYDHEGNFMSTWPAFYRKREE